MIAHLRKIRISPKKANLVAGLVRRKPVMEALALLKLTPKKGAKIIGKVIQSASANAQNNFKQTQKDLIIKEIIVTEGPTYKRYQPVSRGRSHPILKRTSHITVKVETNVEKKTTPKKSPENDNSSKEPVISESIKSSKKQLKPKKKSQKN